MRTAERDIDRILTRLRSAIRERGFTQADVQDVLGWGRSYISQLLTQQKSLRLEQVLLILNVIDLEPEEFFGEIYSDGEPATVRRERATAPSPPGGLEGESTYAADFRRLKLLLRGIVDVLLRKDLIAAEELASAVERAKREL